MKDYLLEGSISFLHFKYFFLRIIIFFLKNGIKISILFNENWNFKNVISNQSSIKIQNKIII